MQQALSTWMACTLWVRWIRSSKKNLSTEVLNDPPQRVHLSLVPSDTEVLISIDMTTDP